MVVLVDTEAGITGIGQGGSPDTVRNVARSVIGRNAFDTEMIWQAAFMDGFYSPGKERLHALGAIDLALWDIKGKALERAALSAVRRQGARAHRALCDVRAAARASCRPHEAAAMSAQGARGATMAAGYRVFRVDSDILPSPGGAPDWPRPVRRQAAAAPTAAVRRRAAAAVVDLRLAARIPLIIRAVEQMRDGVGPDGNWMIDLHQKFDFHEAVEVCRLMEPHRPFFVEDPLREEQFRTQMPKLRLLTSVPLAPGEEWGTRADFSPLVEQRDIDFARVSLPNVGGITEMLKIMAVCDTHKVGHRPAFHRTDRDRRSHADDDGVPGAGADGIQPGRAAGAVPCPSSSSAGTARCGRTIGPGSASAWTKGSSRSSRR